jgi:hypothetical protein
LKKILVMGLKGLGAKTPSIVTPLNCDNILYEKLGSKLFTVDHLTLKIIIGLWSLLPQFVVQCILTYYRSQWTLMLYTQANYYLDISNDNCQIRKCHGEQKPYNTNYFHNTANI